jgi:hypothetical protein
MTALEANAIALVLALGLALGVTPAAATTVPTVALRVRYTSGHYVIDVNAVRIRATVGLHKGANGLLLEVTSSQHGIQTVFECLNPLRRQLVSGPQWTCRSTVAHDEIGARASHGFGTLVLRDGTVVSSAASAAKPNDDSTSEPVTILGEAGLIFGGAEMSSGSQAVFIAISNNNALPAIVNTIWISSITSDTPACPASWFTAGPPVAAAARWTDAGQTGSTNIVTVAPMTTAPVNGAGYITGTTAVVDGNGVTHANGMLTPLWVSVSPAVQTIGLANDLICDAATFTFTLESN